MGAAAHPALAKALHHHDPTLRERAAVLLVQGPTADLSPFADDVLAALESPQKPEARAALLRLIPRVGPAASRAVPALFAALADPTAGSPLRAAAIEALQRLQLPSEDLIPVLARSLEMAPPGARRQLLQRIAQLKEHAAALLPDLRTLVRQLSSAPVEREGPRADFVAAVGALGAVGRGAPGTLSALIDAWHAALNDPERSAILDAIALLTPPPEDDVSPFLALLPKLPVPYRQGAAYFLATLGPRAKAAVPWLTVELRGSDGDTVSAAGHALGRIGPDAAGAFPELLDALAVFRNAPPLWGAVYALLPEAPEPFLADLVQTSDRYGHLQALERVLDLLVERSHAERVAEVLWGLYGSWPNLANDISGRLLVRLLPHAPRTLERVLDNTGAPDEERARPAVDLAAASPPARARLAERSRHADPALRLGALRVLGSAALRDRTPAEVLLIAERLDDASPVVRVRAARLAAGRAFDRGGLEPDALTPEAKRRALGATLEYLRTPEGRREEWPVHALALAEPGLEEAIPVLLEAFLEEPEEARASRLGGFVLHQAKRHPAALRAAVAPVLDSPSVLLRARAAWVWGHAEWEPEAVDRRLAELLASDDPAVRRWALRASAAADHGRGTSRKPLLEALGGRDPTMRDEAVRMLLFAKQMDAEVLATVRVLLLDRTTPGRRELAHALALGGSEVVPVLVAGLDDVEIRHACLNALSNLGPKAVAALPRLERLRTERPLPDAETLRYVGNVIDTIKR
jgi:hypothetical protein